MSRNVIKITRIFRKNDMPDSVFLSILVDHGIKMRRRAKVCVRYLIILVLSKSRFDQIESESVHKGHGEDSRFYHKNRFPFAIF
jgi:hypothetical protein